MPGHVAGAAALALGLAGGATDALACDEIARRLDGQPAGALRGLWRQFGIPSRLFAEPDAAPLRVLREGRPPHVILSVRGGAEGDRQYLVFARRPDGCRFVGAVDVPGQPHEPPSHRLVELPEGQTALAVRAVARAGTGLALVKETWYLLADGRLPVILDYPVRGHMIGWPSTFDRDFATSATPHLAAGAVDEVRVEFRATYTSGSYIHWMPVELLFESTRRAYYTWKRGARRFVLDPVRSDVDGDEIEGLFDDAEEQFLRHNVQELTGLAARASDRQQAWLRHFLDSVPDGPEKRAVMERVP